MKALILSGGSGTRLRPLTYTNAKQLLPVANKPVLHYIIDKVVNAGITDIGIIVGDTCNEIKSSVCNGEKWNVNVSYIQQDRPQGLAHAVKTASPFLGSSDFVMILGDNLFQMNLDTLIDDFHNSGSNASILLHKVKDPSHFGVAVVENCQIIRLAEKPKDYISDLIITGVYVFDQSIFRAIEEIKPSPRGELEITDAIQRLLETGGKISYQLTEGWWKDTGKLSDMLEANRLVLSEIENEIQSDIGSDSSYTGKVRIGKDVTIKNSILTGPVVIGDHSMIVNSFIGPNTSVSEHVKIEHCWLENSIILRDTEIQSLDKKIKGSLIGKNSVLKGKTKENEPDSSCFLIGDSCEIYL